MAKSTDKDIIRAKEQYKTLTKNQKLEYILEYYRFHILIAVVGVFVVCYTVYITFINPPLKPDLAVYVLDQYLDEDKKTEFIKKYNDLIIEDRDRYEFVLVDYVFEQNDPQYLMAIQQKFTAEIAAAEVDVIIAAEEAFGDLIAQGVFMPIGTVYPDMEINDSVEIVSGREATDMGFGLLEDYGIILDKERCKDIYDIAYTDQKLIIGFLINTKRLDTAKLFAEKLCIFPEFN